MVPTVVLSPFHPWYARQLNTAPSVFVFKGVNCSFFAAKSSSFDKREVSLKLSSYCRIQVMVCDDSCFLFTQMCVLSGGGCSSHKETLAVSYPMSGAVS